MLAEVQYIPLKILIELCVLYDVFDINRRKSAHRSQKGNFQDYFADNSTAFLNAPSNAVSWIFSLAPVDSLYSVVAR